MLKHDDFVKGQLVAMGWRFGQVYGGGPLAGQMVMSSLANRVRAGWGSWLDVLERVPQTMAESELPPLKFPSVWEPSFVKLLHAVDSIYEYSLSDMTHGGLFWCDLNNIGRPWFQEKIIAPIQELTGLRQHPAVANMNSLTFFR
jgi:hypothetical protein